MGRGAVTIVIPVYADWSSLGDCLDSLAKYVDTTRHKIMIVNDCGPEADELEKRIQESIKSREGFEYYKNPGNLGFLKTCNKAVFELDKTKNDILLLNSDTKVTKGFLEEMSAVLSCSDKIGAVSPRTNNATLATIPLSAAKQKGIDVQKSFKVFQKIKNGLPRYNEVPTVHGFCMLIKRTVIEKYGLFDEVFGKGYGEENDFCIRIKKHGYLSVLANHAYVFHLEAKSFTFASKNKMLERNLKILYERHPEYRQQVRDYMETALKRENKLYQPLTLKLRDRLKLLKTLRF
jgi:GT2 family glycosyltransferase